MGQLGEGRGHGRSDRKSGCMSCASRNKIDLCVHDLFDCSGFIIS